jgi:hypothetical protein
LIDASSSSSKDINVHTPVTEVRALTELDSAYKVLAHLKKTDIEFVVLVRPDGSLFYMSHDGQNFVDHSEDPDAIITLSGFKSELEAGSIHPMDIDKHLTIELGSNGFSFGDKRFESLASALVDPKAMAMISPWWRMKAFRGAKEWERKGAVLYHYFDPYDYDVDEIIMESFDSRRLLYLKRDEKGFKEVEVPENAEELFDHFDLEVTSGSIGVERLGRNTIIVEVGDKGFALLTRTGGRFVATDSVLTDPFLGPRIGMHRRMKCHTVPKVDSSLQGSLEEDYIPIAHYILNNDLDAQMVVTKKVSDGSIWILMGNKDDEGGRLSVCNSKYSIEKRFVENMKKLSDSGDFVQQSWKDHTVYEWNEKESYFAIHELSQRVATIVPKNSELPAVRFLVEFIF